MKALFPGTFDPLTLGHLDLIERGSELFDHLVVGVAINGEKTPLFRAEERVQLLKTACVHLSNVEVEAYSGLTAQFAKAKEVSFLLRGVRSFVDLEHEKGYALANRRLTGIDTLFLLASGEHAHISSTIIRDIGAGGGDLSPFIPESIVETVSKQLQD